MDLRLILIPILLIATYPADCQDLDIPDVVEEPTVAPPEIKTGCGYRNIKGLGIKSDNLPPDSALFAEFPFVVAILHDDIALDMPLKVYKCGGSLIAPHVVLTAAHCVQNIEKYDLIVRAGEWNLNSTNELYPHQERFVQDVIIHADFNNESLFNDAALLFLDLPFDLAPNVNTACLPPADVKFNNKRCYVVGWGRNQFRDGELSNILKKVELPVLTNDDCEESLRRTRLSQYFRLHSSFVCAGGERTRDACSGEGGSPLLCPIENSPDRFYQAGIVAWGIGCGERDVPGVYADVIQLRRWLDEQLALKRIEAAYYTK